MKKYSRPFLEKLYRTMIKIRFCEESLVDPIVQGKIKTPCHLYSGQEAIATGVCSALEPRDYLFGFHRSHGHYLAKGGSLNELISEIYCRETGCSRGRGGSMHLIAPEQGMLGSVPIVAGTISLAVGAALASKIKGEDRVTVSFFGDGAMGEGVVYESFNFASLMKLPIIFVCENNYYSTHLPLKECRAGDNIFMSSAPFCFPGYRIDGNDVLKVYESVKKVVKRCRSGQGPLFFEFMTYRLRGHVGPDDNIQGDHIDIRPPAEVEKWKKKDPIKKLERLLIKNRVIPNERLEAIQKEVGLEIREAHQFAINSKSPSVKDLGSYVFRN